MKKLKSHTIYCRMEPQSLSGFFSGDKKIKGPKSIRRSEEWQFYDSLA